MSPIYPPILGKIYNISVWYDYVTRHVVDNFSPHKQLLATINAGVFYLLFPQAE
jgi:hypothetical protein